MTAAIDQRRRAPVASAPRPLRSGSPSPSRPARSAPDPARLACVLVRAWLDVRSGHRPLQQLEGLIAPALRMRLAVQVAPTSTVTNAAPKVRTATCQQVRPDAYEAVVLVTAGQRTTAVAVRLEIHAGAWRAVELTAPEAGMPAARTVSRPEGLPRRDAFDDLLDEHEATRFDTVMSSHLLAAESDPFKRHGSA